MYAETEGIILKQFKTLNGRRMVVLFSKKYGKISAGTGISERGKSRAALAMRPFTHGRYDLYKIRDSYSVSGAEVIKAYYKIGEDVDKYMCSSYVLEFTDQLLPENVPSAEIFKLLLDFFELIETRGKKHMTLAIAFQLKAMQAIGSAPEMKSCVCCGIKDAMTLFSIREGGVICEACRNNIDPGHIDPLIYAADFAIIEALKYFFGNPFKSMEHIALSDKVFGDLQVIVREYRAYHLDIGTLKSEAFISN